MALPVLPNTSNFLGVALVINRSHDGPRCVFHYPANILSSPDCSKHARGDENLDDDMFADGSSHPSGLGNTGGSMPTASELAQWNRDDHLITESGIQIVPWERVAGFPTKALEGILTPAKSYHKSKFQVSLDPIYFVSYPIYVPESGNWRKKKKKKQKKQEEKGKARGSKKGDDDADVDPLDAGPRPPMASDADQVDAKDMAAKASSSRDQVADAADDAKPSSMTMFNLVFILNPKKNEVKELVEILYSNIIKKVNKVYKYSQQKSDFVWKESKKILTLKDKAREDRRKMSSLWNEILGTSSLAASMQDVYDAISQNKIANLQLDTTEGTIAHSVQIPMPFHISELPQEHEDAARGLWITTTNAFVNDEIVDEPGYLDKNFALLLMDDEKKIIAELQTDPDEEAMAMVEFVKHSKPTLSFHQVAQQPSNILTLGQVRKYAEHFIYWRRAIPIPPLHARDTYTLSPNCDMGKLAASSAEWSRAFPLAPALPDFLAMLSRAPRPYKSFCPAKSYRPDYLRMLAWLMRGGWVTQLCTFAYVIVWPEIIYEVEYALEADELAKAKRAQKAAVEELEGAHGHGHETPSPDRKSSLDEDGLTASTATLKIGDHAKSRQPADDAASLLSTSTSLPDSSSTSTASHRDTGGASSSGDGKPAPTPAEQAAERARKERLADKAARELAETATAHARKAPPLQTAHPQVNYAAHLEGLAPRLILDARKPSGKESLYLMAIGRRLRARGAAGPPGGEKAGEKAVAGGGGGRAAPARVLGGAGAGKGKEREKEKEAKSWDDRVADTWPLVWRYFDGRQALERIALQEDMKRKDMWNLLTGMAEYLLCVRHW